MEILPYLLFVKKEFLPSHQYWAYFKNFHVLKRFSSYLLKLGNIVEAAEHYLMFKPINEEVLKELLEMLKYNLTEETLLKVVKLTIRRSFVKR